MPLQISPPAGETIEQILVAIETALPGARVEVSGQGGRFEIRVVSGAFAGKNPLGRQRLVYAAIAPLMKGERAPLHAVDKLETLLP